MSASKWVKILVGAVLIALGLASYVWWWSELWLVFRGLIGLFVAFVGLIVLLIGWSD